MAIGSSKIRVFCVSPRPRANDPKTVIKGILQTAHWSERFGCTGALIPTSNDSLFDPWVAAQAVLSDTKSFSPLVALNPIYMQPFTAAKIVSSLTYLYSRRIYINLVAGAALSHQRALNDDLDHDARYRRLTEFTDLLIDLLASPAPVSFQGDFFTTRSLQLLNRPPAHLFPEFLMAGQSNSACSLAERCGGTLMQMLQPNMAAGVSSNGVYFGLITRPTEESARAAAHSVFPDDADGHLVLDFSMQNTDSEWKNRMKVFGTESTGIASTGFWTGPFATYRSDGPWVVGSYRRAADLVFQLLDRGVDTFILELVPDKREYEHASFVFEQAKARLSAMADTVAT
ncbi:MAG TPA: LLM class flavin-dependent oxidoreductase [Bryobacteraceae bacterium]|jgi:alkanesulfonate monooxygenase|nr:LLM class flavin-dependent oxidoreductase [Bryobacteraceae bacterium]